MNEYIVRETGYSGTLKQEIVQELVRCRDCQWYEIYQLKKDGTEDLRYKPSYCVNLSYQTRPDWYCADGARMRGEEDGF